MLVCAQGKVFSASFCPDDPTTLAVAGSKANLQIWDTATCVFPSPFRPSRPSPSRTDARTSCPSRSNPGIRTVFGDRLRALGKDLNKSGAGIVGVADDDEGDMDSDDE